jgi:hypothetical protein
MTSDDDEDANDGAAEAGAGTFPRGRSRVRLDSLDRVRREMARLYKAAAYDNLRNVGDASKLAHILTMIARILEASDLERRVQALEAATRQER